MRIWLLVLAVVLTASAAAAEDHRWFARLQAGHATLHDWDPSGSWYEGRVGRSFPGGVLSADLGLVLSGTAEDYASVTAGFEVLPFPRALLSPFARLEAGVMGEPEYGGWIAGAGAGLAIRLDERLSFRGGAGWGVHGDVQGPIVYSGGLQLRW